MSPCQVVDDCVCFLSAERLDFLRSKYLKKYRKKYLVKLNFQVKTNFGSGIAGVQRTRVPYCRVYLQTRRGHSMLNQLGAVSSCFPI